MTIRYRLLIRLLVPFVFIYFWVRGRKAPEYRQRWRERLALQPVPACARDGILIHCVSVGETVAARGLIERILNEYPHLPVTLTSMTPTAADLAHSLFSDRVHHCYLPIDTPGAMRRFFNKLAPRFIVILETELWPNMLAEAKQRQIPTVVVNARLSERSFKTYQKYQGLLGPIWSAVTFIAAQTKASCERFKLLGVADNKVAVRGNLKFDFQVAPEVMTEANTWRERLQRPILVAASTHDGEDEVIYQAFQQVLKQQPQALLIIVPRHPERFNKVAQMAQQLKLSAIQRSHNQPVAAHHQVLIGDTMGELLLWYAMADVALVGGSLIERGGHNPLEPVATKTPVLTGPHVFNFTDIFQRLENAEAVGMVSNAEQLATHWLQLLESPQQGLAMVARATQEFANDQGATEAMLKDIKHYLKVPDTQVARTMKMIKTLTPTPSVEIWYDAAVVPNLNDDYFSADYWQQQDKVKGSATGRSTAWFIAEGEQGMLLRHYYRGGLVGKVNKDRFKREPIAESRAMAEFSLLLKLQELKLPVPRPIAARYEKASLWGYRADILVETIPHTKDVFKCLLERQLTEAEWQTIGQVIYQLHEQGVYHSDLNCHNLMLDAAGQGWIVDFDKCGFREPGEWQQANLNRLLRSLKKELGKAEEANHAFHWQESRDWPLLLAGYGQ